MAPADRKCPDFEQLAQSDDQDWALFLHNLTARPKFGYGPIEPELGADGKPTGFAYGMPANDVDE